MAGGNLGNLWYELSLKDNDVNDRLKAITDALKNIGNGKTITVDLAGDADKKMKDLKAQVESLSKSSVQISVDAVANTVEVKNFRVSDEAINNLAAQITAGLAKSAPIQIGNVNTSSLQNAVLNAVKNGVEIAKPSIIDKIKQAVSSNNSKISIAVDSAKIAKDIAHSLANAGIKLTNVKVEKDPIVKAIENALKSKTFTIDIAINKMEIANAVQQALTQAGYKNVMGYSASDARLDKSARDAMKAEDAHALAQERLKKAQLDTARAAERNAKSHNSLTREVSNTTLATNVLGDAIGNVFSVYAVKNFAQEIIQVGGELEKMRMAMGSIMGDTYKADTIFKQVSDLSMVSPFDVQDLVQYTKQLNAFGIQYSDLYDTTKRLSDIAAATGVSFGRIAYEFGQTSARGWLDGRELRMFANSGIPLLQKLSDYYTKTMGKIVSSSEVREMVTKRKVSFDDVRKVLWQLTDEGGAFYQMQEVMAESLSAKWVNLANDWNLMLGKIAESGTGDMLKRFAELLMKIVENWRVVGGAIMPVVGYLGLYSMAQALANKQALAGAAAQMSFGNALKMSGKYLAATSKAMFTNPATYIMALISTGFAAWQAMEEKAAEAEERAEAVSKKATEGFKNISEIRVSPSFTVEPKNEAEYKQAIKRMTDYVKDYAPDSGDVLGKIFGDKDNAGLKTMKEQYDALKGVLDGLSESYRGLIALKDVFNSAEKITDGFFDEGLIKNLQDVGDASADLDEKIKEMLAENGIGVAQMLEKVRSGSEDFTKAVTDEEGNLRSLSVQLRTLILDFNDLYNANSGDIAPKLRVTGLMADWFGMGDVLTNLDNSISDLNGEMKTAYEDIDTFLDKYESKINELKQYDSVFKTLTGDQQKRAATMSIVASIQDNISNPYARELLYNRAVERGIIFKPSEYLSQNNTNAPKDKPKGDPELDKWKERFKVLKEAYAEYKRWYDLYNNSEKAIAKTKENPLFANLDVDPSALWQNLDALSKQVKTNTKKRREFQLQVEGEKVTITYNNDKDSISKAVSDMKEQLDRETKNWNLYQKLFEATGDKNWAHKISFDTDKQIWDEQAERLKEKLGEAIAEKGLLSADDMTYDVDLIDWSMTEEQAKKFFGEDGDLVELYLQTKKTLDQNGIDYFTKLAEAYKEVLSIEQKIAAVEERRKVALETARKNGASQQDINAINYQFDQEISSLNLDKFKDSINWEAIFGNLDTITKKSLKAVRKELVNFRNSKEYKNMKIVDKQAVDKGLKEVNDAISKKSGIFSPIVNAINDYKGALQELKDAELGYQQALLTGDASAIKSAKERKNAATVRVQETSGTVKNEEEKALSKAQKISEMAKSIANAGDKALGTIAGVASQVYSMTGETWTGIVALVLNILDAIGDDFKGFLGDLLGSVMHAVGGILEDVGGLFGISGLGGIFGGADYKEYEDMVAKFEQLNDVWDSILNKKKAYIKESWAGESVKAAEEAKKIASSQLEVSKKLAETLLGSGASAGSHSITQRMWEGSYKSVLGRNWNSVASEISRQFNVPFNNMSDMLNMSGDTLQSIKENYADLWAAMDGDFRKYLEDIITYQDSIDEIDETLQERITQTSFDSLRDSFVDTLMDMDSKSEDFAGNFSKLMMNAMVNNHLLGKDFDKWLDGWWGQMKDAVSAGDTDAQNKLNEAAQKKREELLDERDRIASALGYTGESSNSSGTAASIKSITAEQADVLAAYVNGMRADLSITRSLIEEFDIPSLNAVAASQLAQLNMIAAHTEAIMQSNASLDENVRDLRESFNSVMNGTKKLYIQ